MNRRKLLLLAALCVGSMVGVGTCISSLLYDIAPLLL